MIERMHSEFWSLIERTRPATVDPAQHAAAIRAELVEEGLSATLRWTAAFDRAMESLYSWELWGAAYYGLAGCSDDTFEYLRAWLIGQGEDTWRQARDDPEGLFVLLLDSTNDPEDRWESLRIHDGEHLLYAGGEAHQSLTGEWIPALPRDQGQPSGTGWEEEALPELYPRLKTALPDDWWAMGDEHLEGVEDGVLARIERGLTSLANGDHQSAIEELDVLVTEPEMWSEVPDILRPDVAYAVGITRLVEGRVDDAETALLLVEDDIEDDDALRRAMAQIQLARGDVEAAAAYIERGERAHRLDRALASKLAWRGGDRDTAVRLARREVEASPGELEHPWDVAGAVYQAGAVLVEAGELDSAIKASSRVSDLLTDAPADLPLQLHLRILRAGVARLSGDLARALSDLDRLCLEATGPELAECLRERARTLRAFDRSEESRADYLRAVRAFEGVGEEWEARATMSEMDEL